MSREVLSDEVHDTIGPERTTEVEIRGAIPPDTSARIVERCSALGFCTGRTAAEPDEGGHRHGHDDEAPHDAED
jgi:hypothetical protein